MHVEPSAADCDTLIENGYQATASTIEEYQPATQADAIVALNSYAQPTKEVLSTVLKPGGKIITNNWTKWAADVVAIEGVRLEAVLLPSYMNDEAVLVEGSDIPPDASGIDLTYTKVDRSGQVSAGSADDPDSFPMEMAYFPDALFVFTFDSTI